MDRLAEFKKLLDELNAINASNAKASFTHLYQKGCELFEFIDEDAARAFDTSRPNASRWRRGEVIPPGASLVLKLLRKLVDSKVRKLERIHANSGYYRTRPPVASKQAY